MQRACAAPGLAGAPDSQVALIAGPAGGTGRALVSPIGTNTGAPLATLTQPGALTVTGVHATPAVVHGKTPSPTATSQPVVTVPASGGVVVQASGAMARGLEAEQVLPGGKISAHCDGPGTNFWFVGPGAFTVPHIQLYLMNVGSQPADVEVQAYTDAGPLQGSTDTGVAVGPHAHGHPVPVEAAARYAHGRAERPHQRRAGRCGGRGHHRLRAQRGLAARGERAGDADRHRRHASTAGTRQLYVAVPGTQDAHITLSAVTDKGTYHPTGGGGLDIPGGSVAELSLTSLSAIYGALEISSDVPITASLLTPGGPRGTPGATTAAMSAVQEQGVVAVNVSGKGAVSSLVLSAPWRAARVRVTEIGSGGGQTPPGRARSSPSPQSTACCSGSARQPGCAVARCSRWLSRRCPGPVPSTPRAS